MRRHDDVNMQALWLLGFAFFEAWGIGALGNWRGAGDIMAAVTGSHPFAPLAQSALMALLLVGLGRAGRRFEQRAFSKAPMTAATVGGIAAMVLIAWTPLPKPLAVALGFCLAIALKYLLLAWFKAFACFDIEIILLYVLAILGSTLVLGGLLWTLPAEGRTMFQAASALGQLFCLRRISRIAPFSAGDGDRCPRRTLAVVLSVSLIFCVLFRLIGSAAKHAEKEPVLGVFCNMFYSEFGSVVVLLGAIVLTAAFLGRRRAVRSFTVVPFCLAAGLLVLWAALCLFFPEFQRFAFRGFGQISVDLVFILFFLLLGKHLGCSSFELFVFDEAVFTGAHLITAPLNDALQVAGGTALFNVMTTVLIISAQSVVVFFVIMGFIILRNGLSDSLRAIAKALSASGGKTSAAVDASDSTHPTPPKPGESEKAASAASEGMSEKPLHSKEGPAPRNDCATSVAQSWGLSERETEVMALLVRGRSMKRAAEELYLSLGTVNTYVKRIYAKLDIHTRQELIDRFEEAAERVAPL